MPTIPFIQPALNAGEFAPQMWGRTDLDKYKKGLSTMRNMFASYRGAALSRAGTMFVGQCKQPVSAGYPPQLIPFQFSANQGVVIEAGAGYMRFVVSGAYVTETAFNVTGMTNANPGVFTVPGNTFTPGDWVFVQGLGGLFEPNGRTLIVLTTNPLTLQNTLTGAPLDTRDFGSYLGGGTMARIFTLSTPYAASNVQSIKWAQSANLMSLTQHNYAPADLSRVAANNWTLTTTVFGAALQRPATCAATPSSPTASNQFWYQYCATAVDPFTGAESQASPVATTASVNIASQAGSILVQATSVAKAASYNFYRGPVSYIAYPNAGALFGFIGSSVGPAFTDSNIIPDFTKTPPLHSAPFAPGQVLTVPVISQGGSYGVSTTTVSINSLTGSGFVGIPIILGGGISWIAVQNPGSGYLATDGVVINDSSGAGSGFSASITVSPASGISPSVVAYFQQRRFYANTDNNPDTFWASQPGAFQNMDASIPTVDSDAIIGTPWSQQINGIQWMINMPGGLVILTPLGAWQLSGGGGGLSSATAITPSNEVATPQAYNGVSSIVRPLTINYDILYVQQMGSNVRDLAYNFFTNIYTGTDLTVLSSHLFANHSIERWDWSEEPNKLVWAVRDDGVLLCLTYLKEQDVYAWSRHDTNGLFQSVCTVSEPPVNATYFVVKRLIQADGVPIWVYYLERMDNRLWFEIEDAWCVDCGLRYGASTPAATLTIASATGTPTLQQPQLINGGSGYGAGTYARIADPTGGGATLGVTVAGGVVTAISAAGALTGGYTNPTVVFVDPTGAGAGAVANIGLANVTTLTASAPVLVPSSATAGSIVRAGGGIFSVNSVSASTSMSVNVVRPVAQTIPNDPNNTPLQQTAGNWSIVIPTSTVTGLDHLEGMPVSILADGVPVMGQTVRNGAVSLPGQASAITVGLGYTAQMQTLYMDFPAPTTVQGQRKSIGDIVIRVQDTPGPFEIGTNQPDASIQPGGRTVPWANMSPVAPPFPGQSPLQPFDLFTGDVPAQVGSQLGERGGQIAIQERYPVPLNVLAVIPSVTLDDQPG